MWIKVSSFLGLLNYMLIHTKYLLSRSLLSTLIYKKMLFKILPPPYEQYIKLLQIKFGDVVDASLGQQIEAYLLSRIQTNIVIKKCDKFLRQWIFGCNKGCKSRNSLIYTLVCGEREVDIYTKSLKIYIKSYQNYQKIKKLLI